MTVQVKQLEIQQLQEELASTERQLDITKQVRYIHVESVFHLH